MKLVHCVTAGLLLAAPAATALACGDSLYRVGKDVAYRTYTAPLPGHVLVFADDERSHDLAAGLAASGHAVSIVHTREELEQALAEVDFDIVIAPLNEPGASMATRDAGATFVPVTASRQDRKAARLQHGHAVTAGDDLKQYLKAIHRALKARA